MFLRLATGLDRERWHSIPMVPEVDWLTHELTRAGAGPRIDAARSRFDFGFFRRLTRLIREERVEVIHSHLFGPTVEAGILSMMTGVPVIGTIHGIGDLSPKEKLTALKFGILRRGIARLVFVSESLRADFLDRCSFPIERTAVIPNGVDPADHAGSRDESVRAEFGIPEDAFLVGALGNLRPVKRYDLFLRAAALLVRSDPRYRFLIVGQDSEPLHGELLRLRSELGLDETVLFTGFRADVERILTAYDLFTITSDREGFSIATIQAMASGLPVVATRCGGPEEILEDGVTGLLVPTGDPERLAQAIDDLRLNPALRSALAAAGRESARARFSIHSQIALYDRLYESAIAERSPHLPAPLEVEDRRKAAAALPDG